MGDVAAMVCAISFAVLMLSLVLVVLKLARTLSITNRMLNDMRKEIIPMVGKLQVTMDHINDEMSYVDGVLKSTQRLAERADSATKAAQKLVTSPLVRVLSLGLGLQKALGLKSSREEE
jgi:uncharacterized protein YoxC